MFPSVSRLCRACSRRQWRLIAQGIGLFSLCMALIVACGGPTPESSSPGESGASDGRISMGTTLQARTLDPADAYEIFPGILLYNLGDRLYTYAPGTTDLVPQLATAMPTISEDGLTYTIPLREDVVLHDGTLFTAEVMAFSIQRFMENGGRPAFLLAEKIESVEASDDYELTITLQAPFAAFPALLTFWGVTPVPPDSYAIEPGSFQPDSFIGSGPYKLAAFSSDVIQLDVNPDYWGEPPANPGVDIQIFSSPANLYNTFRTGGVDVAYQTLDPEQIASLEQEAASGGWQVIEAGTTVINYMSVNQKIEPFDDGRVRQAMAAMIDRPLINQRVFQGQAEPLYSLIPTSFEVYEPVFEDAYGDGNFDLAEELLRDAGFSEAAPFTFEIWYPSASTPRSIVANTLKESIEQALPGLVTVNVQTAESATLWENVDKGVYPTVLANWYPDYYDADTFIQPFMSCDQGSPETLCEQGASQGTGSFYYSEPANELIAQQRAESDPEARQAIFRELQQLLAEDVPYIPLWQNKDYVFAQAGVDGVAIQPTQQFLLGLISKE
ncbi:Glutathione-binding protein GsiB [Halomicronema hongdechloris C2206]|uniref:Glutathione-binding protein GsiB n=1 Tax=Halomicronema hongdechloris C2206 TaxID=1641165 RepID=A0A1Z3HMD2_9CYAN|nr:ABC transporter substrate-binding protein [Halomicronema hongdechloris]ASC71471.1 Glutathione-binding protein GsiB [Halomicronema hongdechloris C2206]